jgi:hypothetical protein
MKPEDQLYGSVWFGTGVGSVADLTTTNLLPHQERLPECSATGLGRADGQPSASGRDYMQEARTICNKLNSMLEDIKYEMKEGVSEDLRGYYDRIFNEIVKNHCNRLF